MGATFGLEGFTAAQVAEKEATEEAELMDIDFDEEVDLNLAASTEFLNDCNAAENLDTLADCAISDEAIMTLVPFMSQDPEAIQYFGLDNPNPAFIRSQLDAATEAMHTQDQAFLSAAIPFIDLYLNSVWRMSRILGKDKLAETKLVDMDDYRFAKIKAYHLDYYDHFFAKVKDLKQLMSVIHSSAKSISNIKVDAINTVLGKLGLVVDHKILARTIGVGPEIAGGAVTAYALSFPKSATRVVVSATNAIENAVRVYLDHKAPTNPSFAAMKGVAKSFRTASQYKAVISATSICTGLATGSLVSGMANAIIQAIKTAYSMPIYTKGWSKEDVGPAIDAVRALLADTAEIKEFKTTVNTMFKEKYKASVDPVERKQLKENRKLLLKLGNIYTTNVIQMARGVHEMCEKIGSHWWNKRNVQYQAHVERTTKM